MLQEEQGVDNEFDLELHLSDDTFLADVVIAQAYTDCQSCGNYSFTSGTGNPQTQCCAC